MILDAKYPELVTGVNSLDLKPMGPRCFGEVKQIRQTVKKKFLVFFPLQKYGRFPTLEDEVNEPQPEINAIVAEEYDVEFVRETIAGENVEADYLMFDDEEILRNGTNVGDVFRRDYGKIHILDDFSNDDVEIVSLKRKVIVHEQDSIMKDAKLTSLEDRMEDKDRRIEQLEGDVTMLISSVYDLKGKLEKKFGEKFADECDKEHYEARTELTSEENAQLDAEREAALQQYLNTPHPKKVAYPPRRRKRSL
ncbi:hypothetical protein Hanom_Chr02g00123611 [Helianthus anomalus]